MMRNPLRSNVGFEYRNFSQAANFCATNKINLDEALRWADQAMNPIPLGGKREFSTLQAKLNVLLSMGKNADGDALMQESIHSSDATAVAIHQYGTGLLNAGQKEKSM